MDTGTNWHSGAPLCAPHQRNHHYYGCTGGPGIQIEKSTSIMDNIEIYDNTFDNTYGPGIWIFNYDASAIKDQGKNVHIYHNIFRYTGTNSGIDWAGGVVLGGFYNTLIENNVFDGSYHAAVAIMYPNGNFPLGYSPKNNKCDTIVRNNIIVNTQKHKKDPSGIGFGIANHLPQTHTITLENNCLYNNTAGKYEGCTSQSDIYVNPLVANLKNHDYHLQSTAGRWNGKTWVKDKVNSPCIDAGYRYSAYSKEPKPNGNRINIGRYGNTIYESKSKN